MIDKNRTYTYEELEKLYDKAMRKALDDLDSTMQQTQKETGKIDGTFLGIFSMQNLMMGANIRHYLFKGENDESII